MQATRHEHMVATAVAKLLRIEAARERAGAGLPVSASGPGRTRTRAGAQMKRPRSQPKSMMAMRET